MSATRRPDRQTDAAPFEEACSLIDAALTGSLRQALVREAVGAPTLADALRRLRDCMRSNRLVSGGHFVHLDGIVATLDRYTREEGFHALHDWDGKADTVNRNTIPIDVLDLLVEARGKEPPDATVVAILLDYYFLYVLSLLSLRVWDHGDANDNLDRLTTLLVALQGSNGSGQQFVRDADTLTLLATSHFELEEQGYDRLLEKVRTLNHAHQANIALLHAVSLGSHLRFGIEATYGRDTIAMRDDNGVDYRWLCYALVVLMREYARMHDADIQGLERESVVEGLLNGLTPDARAFIGEPPASLAAQEDERSELCSLFHRYRADLLGEFQRYRPTTGTYSPISLFFNFLQNVVKGTTVDALLRGEVWDVSLNDLLTGRPDGQPTGESKLTLARMLMGYARANPDTIRGRLMPVIVYDPWSGRQVFSNMMRKLKG